MDMDGNGETVIEAMRPGAPRLTVIGTGYLGATHAVCMAARGYEVLGLDVDAAKIRALANGQVPFFEPGLAELLAKVQDLGRLRFTSSYEKAAAFGDVHFLCVGTPQQHASDAADLSYVDSALTSLAVHLDRPCLVVGKSTVPVGTAERLSHILRLLAPAGAAVELAWNPEFLREGFAVADTMAPDRLVFGVPSESAEGTLREAFAPMIEAGSPVIVTDLPTAELVKVAANSFLATKISFINAMAEICEATGADVLGLKDALSLDTRIGGRFLHPGLGFGGGCLPKDIRAFRARATELGSGEAVEFLREVDAVNLRCRQRTIEAVRGLLDGELAGRKLAVLGAAFKPDSDDIRDSPALDVASQLHSLGATVVVTDPAAIPNARRRYPHLAYADNALAASEDADAVVLLTEWVNYRHIDPTVLGSVVRLRNVVDARNALDARAWRDAGWAYSALGRGRIGV